MQSLDPIELKAAEQKFERDVRAYSRIPVPYVFLLAMAALFVSVIGAAFSVTGLAKLFSGAPAAVMAMAASLEFAKLVAAGFLHHNWKKLSVLFKIYLSVAVATLMIITSLGIFGYLSNAYQKSSLELNNLNITVDSLRGEIKKVQEESDRIQRTLDAVPTSRVTRRIELQKEAEPEIKRLKAVDFELQKKLRDSLISGQTLQTEVGPLIFVADTFKVSIDVVARWFILIFVSVFDPLAVCLVFAVSWSLGNTVSDMPASPKKSAAKVKPGETPEPAAPRRRRRRRKRKS